MFLDEKKGNFNIGKTQVINLLFQVNITKTTIKCKASLFRSSIFALLKKLCLSKEYYNYVTVYTKWRQ